MGKGEKFILFLGGGAMAGVFGAGIAYELHKLNVYNRIRAIYGSSAGVYNMAYFMAAYSNHKQIDVGASIYWENLQRYFIYPGRAIKGIFRRFWDCYVEKLPKGKILSIIDIDHLIRVAKDPKRLDLDALNKCPINGFAKVFDTRTQKMKYKDIKKNTFQILTEASSAIPYYSPKKRQKSIDAGSLEIIGFDDLRKKHPKEKIVVCLNYRFKDENFIAKVRNFFEGALASLMYPGTGMITRFLKKVDSFNKDIANIKSDKNALLICPPENDPATVSTIDPILLKKSFRLGRKEARKIIEWI